MKLESWSFHGWQLYIEMNNFIVQKYVVVEK